MGEADKYLNGGSDRAPQQQYGQQQYAMPQYDQQQQYNQGQWQQPPPNGGFDGAYDPSGGYNYGPPPTYSYNPPKPNDEKYGFEEAFKIEKPKYNDVWAGLLVCIIFAGHAHEIAICSAAEFDANMRYHVQFLACFAGFVAVSVLALRGYVVGVSDSGRFTIDSNTLVLFACALGVAFVLSIASLSLARMFPKTFIWVTCIINIAMALGTAFYYLYKGYWSAGIVFLITGLFTAFAFWTWIPRIPFSALMLCTSMDVGRKYGHVFIVSFIGGTLATALAAWFAATAVGIHVRWDPTLDSNKQCGSSCSSAKVIGLMAFATFAMYWITEWLKNTIHTIICGVYGSWYFAVHNFPKNATRASSKRALTYSFGSIALGSLLVAIIQFLRQLCSIARQQSAQDSGIGGFISMAIFCFLQCIMGFLEWAVEFINRYAYVHIALYGKKYITAAKDTWKMIKDRGVDALVNECLIGTVLSIGALFVGYTCALLAFLFLQISKPTYNRSGNYTAFLVAYSFLIGFQIANIFTTPISSGVETIFVASAWDPQVMIQDHPELYQDMVRVYPHVQQVIYDR